MAMFYEEIAAAATARGLFAVVASTNDDPDTERVAVESLVRRRVDGLILTTARIDTPIPFGPLGNSLPHVLALRTDDTSFASLGDDRLGAHLPSWRRPPTTPAPPRPATTGPAPPPPPATCSPSATAASGWSAAPATPPPPGTAKPATATPSPKRACPSTRPCSPATPSLCNPARSPAGHCSTAPTGPPPSSPSTTTTRSASWRPPTPSA